MGKIGDESTDRAIAMEMIYRYSRIVQQEIGKQFGNLDYSAVSPERKRLRERNGIGLEFETIGAIQERLNQRLDRLLKNPPFALSQVEE